MAVSFIRTKDLFAPNAKNTIKKATVKELKNENSELSGTKNIAEEKRAPIDEDKHILNKDGDFFAKKDVTDKRI